MATHDISLFFYIKGSKDFPSGHGIDEKFGFDRAIPTTFDSNQEDGLKTGYLKVETPVFNTTIRDIYLKNKGAREISNTYSLISDVDNCIYNYSRNNPSLGVTNRTERSLEYLSTMIVKPATGDNSDVENELYKQIYPNYTYTSKTDLEKLLNITPNDNPDYPPRQSIFWQKMFTLLEYLKKHEKDIINDNITNSFPRDYNANKETWWNHNTLGIEQLLNNETSVGRYIGLFIGAKPEMEGQSSFRITAMNDGFKISAEESNNGGTPVTVNYETNPFRNIEISGTDGTPINTVDNNTGIPNINVIQEKLWDDLNISYVPGTAYFETSSHEGRIKKIYFSVKYKQYGNTTINNYDIWNFTIYFDPDAFVADSTTNRFGVWTYNDIDLDSEYPEANEPGFNIYDNDYANMLIDDPTSPKRGHFIATEEEVNKAMAKAMLEEMKGNDYTDFKPVKVIRVSPEIIKTGTTSNGKDIYDVHWPSINGNENPNAHGVGEQTFYIFYNTVPPSSQQEKQAIKDYLLNLHSKCAEQTYYSESESKAGVKYIGHPNSGTGLTNWLAHMYPGLFSETVVYIIPPLDTHRFNLSENNSAWVTSNYFHTETQKRIVESMRYVSQFKNFQLEPNGNVGATTNIGDVKKYFGTEVFYIGGLNNDQNNNNAFNFPAPFIATMENENFDTPLTSQTGFAGFVPKFFDHNASPTSPADLLQYILIKLMNHMFINDRATNEMKTRLNPIAGVNIEYSVESETDPSTIANPSFVTNVASFTINGVTFKVYSQRNKNFGAVNGAEESD